ncbi:MAG TPA: asparagine synthase (glutamine-hydrolyzing) [Gammaproteobacteria bacterium]|nr:asparagine synthase (glutamine-hydrolyzing) [Gammaproteobacteria bacterium]
MCGITGFFGNHQQFNPSLLKKMNQSIYHRGPDGEGYHMGSGVGLAMRRLSIIDLEGGDQPIYNEDKSICVVFNGEIYNYQSIRKTLISQGHRFRTHSDTEVIVHLYEQVGIDFVNQLQGMFAIALWDSNINKGYVFRDRLGIKPLYWSQAGNSLLFGSELKTILCTGIIEPRLNYQALDAFFAYTYIPNPLTIYSDIHKLRPGHYIEYSQGDINTHQYWDFSFTDEVPQKTDTSHLDTTERLITDCVESHMVSDVPVGAFLSGGVDSSLIVALMAEHTTEPIETFTMAFDGLSVPLLDERPYARKLEGLYDINFNEYTVKPEVEDIIAKLTDIFDEPFADDSVIPSYYVSRHTSQKVKVAMSGLGGDELYAGYYRYIGFQLSEIYSKIVPRFIHKNIIDRLIRLLPELKSGGDKIDHIKRFSKYAAKGPALRYVGYVSSLDHDERSELLYNAGTTEKIDFNKTDALITDHFETAGSEDILSKVLYTDMKTYLPEDILALSDRMSMHFSLELRVPFIDHRLVEESTHIPSRLKLHKNCAKIILKDIARKFIPGEIIDHKKQGFEAPMGAWLKNELKAYSEKMLLTDNEKFNQLFRNRGIKTLLEQHQSGQKKNNKILYSLITFKSWLDKNPDIKL